MSQISGAKDNNPISKATKRPKGLRNPKNLSNQEQNKITQILHRKLQDQKLIDPKERTYEEETQITQMGSRVGS
ncbi:MAG: hypothetical protein ACON35_02280 [Candidatus Marinamargulisbacteria bacterium]